MIVTSSALEARARRSAHRIGLVARKSRWRRNSCDNLGGFILTDPWTNTPVVGFKYDLTAEAVIKFCANAQRGADRNRSGTSRR